MDITFRFTLTILARRTIGCSERSLLTRVTSRDEWRFRDIVDMATNEVLFTIEHEVRSVKHPLFGRPLVNRNPAQNNRHYVPGNDAFSGKF